MSKANISYLMLVICLAFSYKVHAQKTNTVALYSPDCITEEEVLQAQKEWGEGIVRIGKVYTEKGDYRKAAMDHIQNMYGYDLSSVLFKPTLASVEQFRGTFDGALSYFIGGNETYPEDKGFAIAPYTNVRWENTGINTTSTTSPKRMAKK